jgi:hypothetical protein
MEIIIAIALISLFILIVMPLMFFVFIVWLEKVIKPIYYWLADKINL